MQIRMTQGFTFQRIREGLQAQFAQMARAQEQLSSGQRLNRPSDDPVATSQLLGLESHLGLIGGQRESVFATRPVVETAAAEVQQASDLMSEARSAMLAAMNGTLGPEGRRTIADQLEGIRESLFSLANTRYGDRYVFGGTDTAHQPFVEVTVDGRPRIVYQGSTDGNEIAVGNGQTIDSSVRGDVIFGASMPTGVTFAGLTGVAAGPGPADGSGWVTLDVRHDGTSGALGAGLAFVGGGAQDTILGDRTLVVDAAANTVQLGSGPAVTIPAAGAPNVADVRLTDADGSELHLDFTGYTGASFSGTVSGAGSISLDGALYEPIDFLNDNLELTDGDGRRLHVDTRGITRAGSELVTFGGTLTVFDVLDGAISDLRNGDGLDQAGQTQRLNARFRDLDLAAENIVLGLGELGARAARLEAADQHLAGLEVNLQSVISEVRDTDVVDAITQLGQAEQSLQVAQAAGARILQQSLLNYL